MVNQRWIGLCFFALVGCSKLTAIAPDLSRYQAALKDPGARDRFRACSVAPLKALGEREESAESAEGERAQELKLLAARVAAVVLQRFRSDIALQTDIEESLKEIDLVRSLLGRSNPRLTLRASQIFNLAKLSKIAERFAIEVHESVVPGDLPARVEPGARFVALLDTYLAAYFTVPDNDDPKGRASRGFVDRNGIAFSFLGSGGGGGSDSLRSIAAPRVASDLTRLVLEAYFDSVSLRPGDPSATATSVNVGYRPISTDDERSVFKKARQVGLRTEAAMISSVGKAIRGAGGIGANEAIAAAGETAIGVISKRLAEHETTCFLLSSGR